MPLPSTCKETGWFMEAMWWLPVAKRLYNQWLLHSLHTNQNGSTFLCHTVSKNGITPLADRVNHILWIKEPDSVKALQEILEAINFYHWFIPHETKMLYPLHALLHISPGKLKWECEHSRALGPATPYLRHKGLPHYILSSSGQWHGGDISLHHESFPHGPSWKQP